jgi:hypothetical protein
MMTASFHTEPSATARRARTALMRATVAAVGLALVTVLAPVTANAVGGEEQRAVPVRPRIPAPAAFDAPTGGKGGISNPVASCTNYRVEPRTTWTLTSVASGWSKSWSWRGTLPGMYFPRVEPGDYRSKTTVRCRTQSKTRTHRVHVDEKTSAETVSRAEWRQIRRGMTRARVANTVGNPGRDPFRYGGKTVLTYDMMPFWRWSLVTYRDGRVVSKSWNVGHD